MTVEPSVKLNLTEGGTLEVKLPNGQVHRSMDVTNILLYVLIEEVRRLRDHLSQG